ncbi:MAG TPA: hypothetical protein VJV78_35050 [Polyangiales bacterium]|nr:hypothetical protein [Polyangiales bacterium]
MFALIGYALKRKLVFELSFVIAFAIGNVTSWAYFNYAYVRFTNFTIGNNHELSAWLTALLVAGAALGSIVTQRVLGRETLSPERFQRFVRRWETLAVTGLTFGLVTLGYLLTGWLNGRWDLPEEEGFGLSYVVRGIGVIGYTLFLVLGARLQPPLYSGRSLFALTMATLVALAQGLSGGRSASVIIIGVLLVGALFSELGFRRWLGLAFCLGLTGMLFIALVGDARSRQGFAHGTVSDRIDAITSAARDSSEVEDDGDGPLAVMVSRFFEPSGQVVIDETVWSQRYAGFENFERLLTLLLPKAVAPDKLPINDSSEVLMRDYGFKLSRSFAVPITLLADAYRRGGAIWVGLLGLCAGVFMRLLLRWTMLLLGPDLGVMCSCSLIISFGSEYMNSVLGFLNTMSYTWLKQLVLFAILGIAMRLLGLLAAPSRVVNPSRFT